MYKYSSGTVCAFIEVVWASETLRNMAPHHDDVTKWKHFPRYWAFVWAIHRSQRPVTRSFDVFFDLRPVKQLSKQSWGWWFWTSPRPLWRYYNAGMVNDMDMDEIHQRDYSPHAKYDFLIEI